MKKYTVKKKNILEGVMWACLLFFAFPSSAYAYLDPGTGSYMLQILLGLLVGALFMVKTFWKNLKESVKNFFKRGEES